MRAPESLPSLRLRVIDVVCLTVAMGAALSPFADAWADRTWMVSVVVGLVLGIAVTLVGVRLRLGPLLTLLLLAAGYLLVGPAAAAPEQALVRVLPSLDAERLVVVGLVESWRAVLTLPVPLGVARGELVVPFAIALLGAVLATTFLWRTRRLTGLAPLTVAACFVAAAAFGTDDASLPLLRALLLVVLLLVWFRWRSLRTLRSTWSRRVAWGTAVVSLAGLAAWGGAAAVTGDDRQVLRDHVEPPLAQLDLKSPLARYREYYKAHETDVLFTFDNLPAGSVRIRMASMDVFDGLVWNVTTTDLATGTSAYRPAPDAHSGSAVRVTVGDAYTGTWVPTVGHAAGARLVHDGAPGVARELLINPATGGVAVAGDARPGDVYEVDWTPRAERTNEVLASEADPTLVGPAMEAPAIEALDELAQKFVARSGASTDFDRAVALEKGFRDTGYFNDGLEPDLYGFSPSGHGGKRLADLVEDEGRMVGNDEQYAAAMAYAAQRMGLPARVVLGFEDVRSDGSVTGDDIAAWVEIAFVEHGWVPFDPTPDEDRTPPPLDEKDDPVPQPYVVQPPVLPEEPEDVQGVPPEGAGKDQAEDSGWELLLALLGHLWTVVKVLLLLLPLWLVLLVKGVRRRRRLRAPDPLVRLSGGWREVTDRARDLGVRLPVGHTRSENSATLVHRFGDAAPTALAATADRHVFGPADPSEAEVATYWDDVRVAVKRMRAEVPWWRRWWAVVSPASLPWRETAEGIGRGTRRLGSVVARTTGAVRIPQRRRTV